MSVSNMLKGHDLFRSLTPKEMERVSSVSSPKSFRKGEAVHQDDGFATHIFVLLEGEVQLRLPSHPGDAGVPVGKATAGEIFGIAPLLGAQRYTATATCLTSCEVLAIEAAPLKDVLDRNPQAALAMTAAVARSYYSRYLNLLKRLHGVVGQLTQEA
jgi:CRP-like cAMP-binding protein